MCVRSCRGGCKGSGAGVRCGRGRDGVIHTNVLCDVYRFNEVSLT